MSHTGCDSFVTNPSYPTALYFSVYEQMKTDELLTNTAILPGPNGQYRPCPELMTEAELIEYLRIPEISRARDHHSVIENLKRMRGLPCIHISNKCLYPLAAVREWIERKTENQV